MSPGNYTDYRPTLLSGKVEQMNHTLKGTLPEFCQETGFPWPDLLPLALLRAHCTPGMQGFSSFELVYG